MPQQPVTSFADDLAAVRHPSDGAARASDDFGADLAAVRGGDSGGDSRSMLARVVDAARTPLLPQIARGAESLSRQIDAPRLSDSDTGWLATLRRLANLAPGSGNPFDTPAWARGAAAGVVQGTGDVLSGMTSPLDLALLATGAKSVQQAGQGIGATARAINAVGSAALAARGAERAVDAHSVPQVGAGLLELAGGVAGVHGARTPEAAPPPVVIRGRLRAAPIAVTDAGEAVLPGNAIPRQAPPPDPSFVRAVPAEYPPREVRGLLPPGPSFIAGENGVVAPLDKAAQAFATDLAALRAAPIRVGPSEVRSIPARVMDRDFDGAKVVNEHFSSDPTLTADAPKVQLTPDESAELRRMYAEMDNVPFTRRTFNEAPVGRGGDLEVVGGAAGAPVFHDIAQGRSTTRAAVQHAIDGMLNGQHSAMGQRALDVARARLGIHPELTGVVSRPILPPEAGDLPQSGAMSDVDQSEFDRFVNRLASEDEYSRSGSDGGREPGEEGRANPALLAHLGGAVLGGTVGAASGDTPEERIRRGLAGAAAGAILPAALNFGGAGLSASVGGRLAPPDLPADAVAARGPARVVDGVSAFPTSARQPGAPSQLHADPLAGTDVFLSKFPEEVRTGIGQILADNGGFEAQRRGVVDPETTQRLAQGVAVDLSRSLKPGTALNAQGVRAYADALAGAQQKINTLAQRVNTGAATDADLVALESARAEAKTIAASIMGGRAEAGRALAEFKVLARVMQTGSPQQIRQAAETLRGDAAQFAQEYAQLPDDPLARYQWLQQRERPSLTDRARSYFYSNILSGVKTHERNIIGNASNALLNVAAQPFAAGADLVRSTVTGAPRTVLFSELKPQAAGALVGIPQGIREMLFTLKNGVTRPQLSGALSAAEAGKLDLPHAEFAGGGANPFNWPMRGLNGADQFFRAVGRNQELYALAFQQAKREGLSGAQLEDRMAHLVTGTDEVAQGIQQRADNYARHVVFQEKPGQFAQGIQQLSQRFPPFAFVVPFVKTPANIIRQGFEYSPAGFGMSAARAGGREGAQALGRAAAGTFGLGYLAYLAAQGKLSGSGPMDPTARAQLMESGWRPNSVKVGDRWVSYMPFQPISTPAAAVADAFDAWKYSGADADAATKVAAGVARTVRSQLNQSFLSGLADFITAIEQGDNAAERATNVAAHTASGFVPFSGALRSATAATDATVRKPGGFVESIKTGIPGASASVPARLDRFGNDTVREGGPAQRALDPFNVSTETADPVLRELGRLGVRMGMPGGTMTLPGKLPITRDESRELQQVKGHATYTLLDRLIAAPGYQQLRDDQKADVLEHAIARARQLVGQQQKGAVIRGRLAAMAPSSDR